MRWVEFVHLRTSPGVGEAVISELNEQVDRCRSLEGLADAVILKHAIYPGDVAVVLSWNNDQKPARTREGVALAEAMSRKGSVEHGVWELLAESRQNKGEAAGNQEE